MRTLELILKDKIEDKELSVSSTLDFEITTVQNFILEVQNLRLKLDEEIKVAAPEPLYPEGFEKGLI